MILLKENGQIDADLFDLFVQEKLYLLYAANFLDISPLQTSAQGEGDNQNRREILLEDLPLAATHEQNEGLRQDYSRQNQ